MQSYSAARTYFNIIEMIAWAAVILGFIIGSSGYAAFASIGGGAFAVVGMVPGIVVSFLGFLGVVAVQSSVATVDSAENSRETLRIAREQLRLAKGLPDPSLSVPSSRKHKNTVSLANPTPTSQGQSTEPNRATIDRPQLGQDIDYRGKNIRVVKDGYLYGGQLHLTLDDATALIDRNFADDAGSMTAMSTETASQGLDNLHQIASNTTRSA